MPNVAKVSELRAASVGKLLNRKAVKPVVANSGGLMRRDAVSARLAETVYTEGWRDFELTLSEWAVGRKSGWEQVSRSGGNLVLQVGFAAEHALLFHRYLNKKDRKLLEFDLHPIRTTGAPTMAWVRLDVCLETGVALIEEIQSDWFREVECHRRCLDGDAPRSRELKNIVAYEKQLLALYGKDWSKATLLAALMFLKRELGIRDVFMHQAWSGTVFKGIGGSAPPVSLYTKLPKAFCFEPTQDVPEFLKKPCSKILRRFKKEKRPLFWRLQF
jgi:hypothetical protein